MEFVLFVRISEQTASFALQNTKRLAFITELESVYSAVRAESLCNTDTFRLSRPKVAGILSQKFVTLFLSFRFFRRKIMNTSIIFRV
jgi:hypothetical protein